MAVLIERNEKSKMKLFNSPQRQAAAWVAWLLACLLALAGTSLPAAEEADLIAILQSPAGVTEKGAACQQ